MDGNDGLPEKIETGPVLLVDLAAQLVHLKPDFVRTNRITWCTYVVYQIIGAQVHSFQHMNLMSVENFFETPTNNVTNVSFST